MILEHPQQAGPVWQLPRVDDLCSIFPPDSDSVAFIFRVDLYDVCPVNLLILPQKEDDVLPAHQAIVRGPEGGFRATCGKRGNKFVCKTEKPAPKSGLFRC